MAENNIVVEMQDYYAKNAPFYDSNLGYNDTERFADYAPVVAWLKKHLTSQRVLEVACGPGHWTQTLTPVVESIVATDFNPETLEEAYKKNHDGHKVKFQQADAYTMHGVEGNFTAGFAIDWWSHIPLSRIPEFLTAFHSKLETGSVVMFADWHEDEFFRSIFSHYDDEGNLIQKRSLPDGQEFQVIKNFPSEAELRRHLQGFADKIECIEFTELGRWGISYTVIK
jgi:demethylmenaquinone methyltransferase/2-methoxy-6-polyprenyl-1,4-benzoquinol methylase